MAFAVKCAQQLTTASSEKLALMKWSSSPLLLLWRPLTTAIATSTLCTSLFATVSILLTKSIMTSWTPCTLRIASAQNATARSLLSLLPSLNSEITSTTRDLATPPFPALHHPPLMTKNSCSLHALHVSQLNAQLETLPLRCLLHVRHRILSQLV